MSKGKFIAVIFCAGVLAFSANAQTSDSTQQILQLQKFPDGLVLTGNRPPTEAENAAVLNVLNQMDTPGWTTNIEKFLTAHPQSPWAASLRHDYAQLCHSAGRTSKALEQWEAAWPLVKDDTSPAGHALAGTILANWMEQLASLGRYQKLQELSTAGDAMNFSNPADRDKFQGAKSSWLMMTAHPGMAFRCGTFALKAVGSILRPGDRDLQQLVGIPSPTNGFSMAQLVELAKKYQLDLMAVKRTASNRLIVPSVVHWRQNHYAAILERQENLYRVSDPTFGSEKWLTAEAINDEAGGEFLIPSSAMTNGWQFLATNETELVRGMGLQFHIKDGKDKGGCPCKSCPGMPVWWVSEPYINLWMADEPISYLTSSGEPFTFRMTYKQRDTRASSSLVQNPGWNHSWFSYMRMNGTLINHSDFSSAAIALYLPGGGEVDFPAYGVNAVNTKYDSETRLTIMPVNGKSGTWAYSVSGPLHDETGDTGIQVIHPDGTVDVYGVYATYNATLGNTPYSDLLLTRRIDPRGRVTHFYYVGTVASLKLQYVVDSDGHTNTLKYVGGYGTSDTGPLSEVDGPYGLKATFKYDANKNLTNLTDAQGLSSSITYDTNNYPTALITPYGTNTFTIVENLNWQAPDHNLTGHSIDRAIQVTDPIGATSLWMYRDDCSAFMSTNVPAGDVPTGTPLGTLDNGGTAFPAGFCYLNSFYWGPRQYAALSTTNLTGLATDDYVRGRMQHWLADSNQLNVTGYLSVERAPSPDGSSEGLKTFYDYQGKYSNFNSSEGTNALPSVVAWRIPNGESHWQWSGFDGFGNETNQVETCTLPDGTLGTRTNQFFYATNLYAFQCTRDIAGSTIVTTTNYVVANLLTQIIGADGKPVGSYGGFDPVFWTNTLVSLQTGSTSTMVISGLRISPRYVTNGVGDTATLTYGGLDLLTGIKSFGGLTTTNFYSNPTNGFLLQTIDLEIGRTNSFSYTSNGLVGTFTNELGLNVALAWDNLLRPVNVQFPDGTYTSNRFDKLDLAGSRDRLGNWTTYGHDGARHLTSTTNANNAVTILNWCGCGALESILDALTNLTVLNHDNAGRLTGYNFPDNSSVTFQLDLAGRMTNVFDGVGRGFTLALNHQGFATNITDALKHSLRRTAFDLRDRPFIITDANSITLTNIFDPLNRVLSRVWPDGISEGFGYNAQGLFAYTNRDGKVTLYGLDVAGRNTSETNANLEVTRFAFNPARQIVLLIDGLQHQRTWQRNEYGWLTNKLDGLNRTAFRQQFNPNGWLTNRWTPEKGNTAYTLDNVGNVTNVFYAGQNLNLSFGFDPLNQLTSMNDLLGLTLFKRDAMGRVIAESNAWTTVNRTYTNGLRTLLTIAQSGTNWTQSYAYDLSWRMTNTTTIAGGFIYQFLDSNYRQPADILLPNGAIITNVFDPLARLKSTALQDHWRHTLDGYTYTVDPLGLRTNIVRDFGLTTNSVNVGYDNISQILSWNAKESDGTPRLNEQLGFAYDTADNLHTRINGNLTQTFTADAADQLSSVTRSGTFTMSGVTPAPALNVTVNGQAAARYADMTFAATNLTLANGNNTFTVIGTNLYGVKATNIVSANLLASAGFAYDNNGNLTNDGAKAFFYDTENQLTNVTQTDVRKTDFVYDGLNRRRIVRDYIWTNNAWLKTSDTLVIFDGFVPAQERDASNNVLVTYTRSVDFSGNLNRAGGIGGLLARTDSSGSLYYHNDASGNVTALMDGKEQIVGRYLYEPFGKLIRMTGSAAQANTMRFSSMPDYWFGGAGFHGRIWLYAPQRWANEDPIQELGGINLISGMHNNPLNYLDPWGFRDDDDDDPTSDARLNMAAKGSGMAADYGYDKETQKRSDQIMCEGKEALKKGAEEAAIQAAMALGTDGLGNLAKLGKAAKDTEEAAAAARAAKQVKEAEEAAKEGNASKYLDKTKGNSVANRATNLSRDQFGKNLEDAGWTKSMSQDGKVANYEKDGARYSVRDNAKSTGGPTADYYPPSSGSPSVKIRLDQQ